MNEYAVMSGSKILCIIKARNFDSATKKAVWEIAKEYQKVHTIKILRYGAAKNGKMLQKESQ